MEVTTSPIDSTQVAKLMQGSGAFIFPSLHESFGMPLAEAMACGIPLITSNNTACREIAGDASVQVDPYGVSAIANAMQELMQKEALRHVLAQRAIDRSVLFSWEKCGQGHLEIFRDIVSGKNSRG
jgi:glycosyltransferase involved in cell wall biosynthesis